MCSHPGPQPGPDWKGGHAGLRKGWGDGLCLWRTFRLVSLCSRSGCRNLLYLAEETEIPRRASSIATVLDGVSPQLESVPKATVTNTSGCVPHTCTSLFCELLIQKAFRNPVDMDSLQSNIPPVSEASWDKRASWTVC